MMDDRATAHLTEDELVLHHYGDSAPAEAAGHLDQCETCRGALADLRRVLAAVETAPVPDPGPFLEKRMWRRLEPVLGPRARSRSGRPGLLRPGRLALAASLLVMVAASFMAGIWRGRAVGDGSIPMEVRQRVLQVAVADHLDRSQLLLTELLNSSDDRSTGPAAASDASAAQERLAQAESLLAAGRIYRQTAAALGEPGLATVLDDLERVLLEVAHASDPGAGSSLEGLRRQVQSSGILTTVRVMGRQMRGTPAPGATTATRAGQRT